MKKYKQFPGFSYKKAGPGFSYFGYKLPVNALFGTCTMAYKYATNIVGFTDKTLVDCDKIIYICDDFVPVYTVRNYHKKVDVFNIHIYDGEKWIKTKTDKNPKYYYLGEKIEIFSRILMLYNTRCIYTHLYPKEINGICGRRENKIKQSGSAYGYMCKSPDGTITSGDVVPDMFVQNRIKNWKKQCIS